MHESEIEKKKHFFNKGINSLHICCRLKYCIQNKKDGTVLHCTVVQFRQAVSELTNLITILFNRFMNI